MRSYLNVEIEHGNNCQAGSEKIGFVESADFCNVSACQHADAYSHIPRSEVGGSGRASLTVGGKVYEQCVVGRKHDAEAYAKHGSQELTNSDGEYQDIFDDLCQLHGDFDHGANRIISLKDMFIEYFNVK